MLYKIHCYLIKGLQLKYSKFEFRCPLSSDRCSVPDPGRSQLHRGWLAQAVCRPVVQGGGEQRDTCGGARGQVPGLPDQKDRAPRGPSPHRSQAGRARGWGRGEQHHGGACAAGHR